MCWTLGLCGRVMVVVVLPFVRWLLSDRGMKPAGVVPGFDPVPDRGLHTYLDTRLVTSRFDGCRFG